MVPGSKVLFSQSQRSELNLVVVPFTSFSSPPKLTNQKFWVVSFGGELNEVWSSFSLLTSFVMDLTLVRSWFKSGVETSFGWILAFPSSP